jgi:aspartyl-tRNA(Asn)/glutamyl-tRNA(Gln) amidotransferase subunit C
MSAPKPPTTNPKIDRSVVLHVAKLASLSLSDAEADRFAGELARIVAHVEQLDAVDTRDVPPTAQVQIDRMPLREDKVKPGLSREEALAEAPAVDGDGFAVPSFLE